MRIRHMRMTVARGLMPVRMTVGTDREHLVPVVVVPVVVGMRMLMLHRFVRVLVSMSFRKMQHHPREHQHASRCRPDAERPIS